MTFLRSVRRVAWTRHEQGWRFALLFGSVFAAVQVAGHLNHEMWRDELHCWGMSRMATGLWDVLTGERRYDGHPFLWYYLLHLVSRISRSYVALHVVAIVLVVKAVVLWLRYAPLPRALRLLLPASYYIVYEYGVIFRGYTLGLLLTFWFCALYHPLRVRYLPSAGILALLAATSMYGTLIALALGFFLFTRGLRVLRPDASDDRRRVAFSLEWLAAFALLCAGLALTAATTWPPSDVRYVPSGSLALTREVLRSDLAHYWATLFPFHQFGDWNWLYTDYLGSGWRAGEPGIAALGLAWLVAWLVALRRSPALVVTYVLGIAMMMVAQHAIYPGGLRHLGHYWVLLLACIWLHRRETRGRVRTLLLEGMLGMNLLVQVVTGIAALRSDRQQVFSGALEAAKFIKDHHLEHEPVIADPDHPTSGLAIALDRPFFFAATGETSDVVVVHDRLVAVTASTLIDKAAQMAQTANGVALIVVNYDLSMVPSAGPEVRLLYRGGPAVVADESFRIYEVTTPRPSEQLGRPAR